MTKKTVRKCLLGRIKKEMSFLKVVGVESSYIFTCICCLDGGSLCVVEGNRCGQSPTPTLASVAVTRRRWGERWTSWGPQERTGGWGGWSHQTEI